MAQYSHSKLSTFEQCLQKYKFRYIDKIRVPGKSVEAFLGGIVHEALEWLYNEVKARAGSSSVQTPTIDDVITEFSNRWIGSYVPEDIIMNSGLDAKEYFNMGVKFLLDYYMRYKPFQDNTLEVEKRISISLDEFESGSIQSSVGEAGGASDFTKLNNNEIMSGVASRGPIPKKYSIIGFIDRLVYNKETGEYEVHDYKTGKTLPKKENVDKDRQLGIYSMAIKNLYGKDKEVKLIWHYLAFDKEIQSTRTNEQLSQLKEETIALIKKVEETTSFPPSPSKLCDYCEYKNICPAWKKITTTEGDDKFILKPEFKPQPKPSGNKDQNSGKKPGKTWTPWKREVQSSLKNLDDFPTVKKYIKEE
jgi:putative RecB family exonuclease